MSEPVAFEYQHEETGVIGYVDQWQIDNGFFDNNPRLQLIGPLYRHPSNTDLEQQLATLRTDYGLLKISRDHERTLRKSCEIALGEREQQLADLRAACEQKQEIINSFDLVDKARREENYKLEQQLETIKSYCWTWIGEKRELADLTAAEVFDFIAHGKPLKEQDNG